MNLFARRNRRFILIFTYSGITLLWLVGCTGTNPTEIAVDIPPPAPTNTAITSNTPKPSNTPNPTYTSSPRPTNTPLPTSTITADLTATANHESTQEVEEYISEIDEVLQMAELSTEDGSLLWRQKDPIPIHVTGYQDYKYIPFEGEPMASDFVLHSEFKWESSGGLAGCNFVFRSEPNLEEGAQYELETIRLSGLPGWDIVYRKFGMLEKNITGVLTAGAINQDQGAVNNILLIAEENKFTVYFNNQRIGSYYDYSKNRLDGSFAFLAWQESGETTCTFENTWLWSHR